MRVGFESFSAIENRRARERLRSLDVAHAEQRVRSEDQYWSIPLFLRLIARIDDTTEALPSAALALARALVLIAERIPVRPRLEQCYRSENERRDFELLASAVLCSKQAAAGHFESAKPLAGEVLRRARKRSGYARAESFRRVAFVLVECQELDLACELSEAAALAFHELEETELVALSLVHFGNALNLRDGAGAGSNAYAKALYFASLTNSARSRRVIAAAATNLSRDAFFASPDAAETYQWAAAAKEALKGTPYTVTRLKVHWVEALVAHRLFVTQYSINQLEKVRDRLCDLSAVSDAMACVADLAEIVAKFDEAELPQVAHRSVDALQRLFADQDDAEELKAVARRWAERPSDLKALAALREAGARRLSVTARI